MLNAVWSETNYFLNNFIAFKIPKLLSNYVFTPPVVLSYNIGSHSSDAISEKNILTKLCLL